MTGAHRLVAGIEVAMRLTVRILGAEVFHIDTDPDEPYDTGRDLSGGSLGSDRRSDRSLHGIHQRSR